MFNWSGLRGRGRDLRAFSPKRMYPFFFFSFPFPLCDMVKWDHPGRSFELGLHVLLCKMYTGGKLGICFQKGGLPDISACSFNSSWKVYS